MDTKKEPVYSTHCTMCDNGKDYGEDEHIPESCPVCGEHKEFSILHRNEIITFDPEGANNYPNISMV